MAGEEWIECALADACSSIDYGLTASAADHDAGPRFLRITDIVSGHINWNSVPHVAADTGTTAKYRLDDGDVVLARTGASTGASAYVKDPPPAVFASYLVRLKAKPEFDSRFLSYYLKSEDFWTFIRGVLGDKSAQPNASASTMAKAPLRAPRDKSEQRAIAHILGTLDDKIELNRRMSETLEAMARALFKSWFVDFDPVRAKHALSKVEGMDGRWRRGSPLHSPLPAGEGAGVRAAPPDRAAVSDSLPADLRDFARELRRRTTDAETLLWRLLRNRLMAGAKFRRQHPLPPYVLDFYCHDAGLAVELDGGQHNEAAGRRHDARRDAFLAQKGIRVLRFWNHEVLNQTEAVLEAIYAAMDQAPSRVEPSPPPPLPGGEGSFHLPAHLYDLFPDRLVDSELGEIPEGWEVGRYSDVVEQLRDPENPLSSPDVLFEHFSIPAFDEGQNPKPEYGQSIKSLKSRVPAGTTLLSKLNPEIERVWLVDVRPGERAVCSTEFLVLRARPPFTRSFVYCFARSILFRQQIEGLVTGTSKSHQRAQVDSILDLAVVMPSSSIVAAFDRSADSLLARTLKCRRESRALAALRDTLLPKLISGELRVPDAERLVEAAQ